MSFVEVKTPMQVLCLFVGSDYSFLCGKQDNKLTKLCCEPVIKKTLVSLLDLDFLPSVVPSEVAMDGMTFVVSGYTTFGLDFPMLILRAQMFQNLWKETDS